MLPIIALLCQESLPKWAFMICRRWHGIAACSEWLLRRETCSQSQKILTLAIPKPIQCSQTAKPLPANLLALDSKFYSSQRQKWQLDAGIALRGFLGDTSGLSVPSLMFELGRVGGPVLSCTASYLVFVCCPEWLQGGSITQSAIPWLPSERLGRPHVWLASELGI